MNDMFLGQIQLRNMSIFTTWNPATLLHKAVEFVSRVKILMLNNKKQYLVMITFVQNN